MTETSGFATIFAPGEAPGVYDLWARMEREFGITQAWPGPERPHLTFHLAESYPAGSASMVAALAARYLPMELRTSGLGIFPGAQPFIYLTVVPAAALLELHAAAWKQLAGATGANAIYSPGSWVPHVTIAPQDLGEVPLGELLTWLATQPLYFPLRATNLVRGTTSPEGMVIWPD